jgi:DNA-binding response OmpR family regulator
MKTGSRKPIRHLMAQVSEPRVALVGFPAQDAAVLRRMLERAGTFCRTLHRDDAGAAVNTLNTFDAVLLAIGGEVIAPALEQAIVNDCVRPVLVVGSEADLQRYLPALERPARAYEYGTDPFSARDLVTRLASLPEVPHAGTAATTILIADDDPITSAVLEATLSRSGLACHIATDGDEALALARHFRPAAVILDVNMPGHDGFQVLQILKADPATAAAHVVMLTGRAEESDVLRGCALGIEDYIVKPFKAADVAERVKALLAAVAA